MKKLKELLIRKGIRSVDLVRELNLDGGRVSLQINGHRALPEKHQIRLANLLHITLDQLRTMAELEVDHE